MKKCILFLACVLCLTLPQVVVAKSDVTVLFTGDLFGQATPLPG